MHPPADFPLEPLKPRELEVLRLMAAGLSNEQIAARLMVALPTVRWHNRQLYSKLGVHSRTLAVARARTLGLLAEVAPIAAAPPAQVLPPSNLPGQTSSFVGREPVMAQVRRLLAQTRLLTLTGPGGTGKTRLALQVAEAVRADYADGVWFIPLAAVQRPGLVPLAAAVVLQVAEAPAEPTATTLVKSLRDKQMLLVFDNFEHLIEAAALLTRLLEEAPRLKLLVTSREVLRLSGEQEYCVPPLTVPEREPVATLEELARYEAVQLFVVRAQANQPAFALTQENAPDVAAICARLDGLPLAIELAAARCKVLTPRQLLARLEQGLGSLGPGPRDAPARQQTLRATIDWSYALLSDDERRLLGRLSVFRGGWMLETMEAVAGGDLRLDPVDGLGLLVDKSLVRAGEEQNGVPRFRMLETVRQYAWEQLQPDEALHLRRLHRDWFLQFAERGGQGMQTADSSLWYARLRAEEHNLHAALNFSLHDPEGVQAALRFAGALYEYWHAGGAFREARAWLAMVLARAEPAETLVYARALMTAGMLAKLEHDFPAAAQLAGRALEIGRTLGDRDVEALALHYLAHVAQEHGDYSAAQHLYERSIELFRAVGNGWGESMTINCWGDMQRQFGHYAEAVELLSHALQLRRAFANRRRIGVTLSSLGLALCRLQETGQAAVYFQEGLAISQALGSQVLTALCISGFGGIAAIQGEAERAARLLGASTQLMSGSELPLDSSDRTDHEWFVAQARRLLPDDRFAAAWARGQQMPVEQILAYALDGLPG